MTNTPVGGCARPPSADGEFSCINAVRWMGTVMELGIVMPNQTFALCGPLEWRYEHDGQQHTQQIPADADLGELPKSRYYAYESTTEGNLELRGVKKRHYHIEPLPEGFPLPSSLSNEP